MRLKSSIHAILESVSLRISLFLILLISFSMLGIFLFEPGANEQFTSPWDAFWYTIVTITTVGYGDKTPTTLGGQIIGLLLMGMGVVVLAAVTGRMASFLVEEQTKRMKGLAKVKKTQNHFIICGWRKEMETLIEAILSVDPDLAVSDIVLINNVPHERMESILTDSRWKGIQYVHGDFIEEGILKRAGVIHARRVLVLADFWGERSMQEVDARTVMAVLAIDALNKNCYVSAELLDQKYDRYLRLANCDEIIRSREYSKLLLANASAGSGLSHVVASLLSKETGGGIRIEPIPKNLIGSTFGALHDHFRSSTGAVVIGVLENTGNFYRRKKEALQEAQKTPDITMLIQNLREVKKLVSNNPVINPGEGYVVKVGSRAILIEASDPNHAEEGVAP